MHFLKVVCIIYMEHVKFPKLYKASSTDTGLSEVHIPYVHGVYHSITVFGVSMLLRFYMCCSY